MTVPLLPSPQARSEDGPNSSSQNTPLDLLRGQRHDRLGVSEQVKSRMKGDDPSYDGEVQTSLTQKMLSAISGSVITSFLVTPLDVVRVRLQSQPTPAPVPQLPHVGTSSSFANLPPNLGVSACCKEVFWVNNNAEFCVAGPNAVAMSNNAAAAAECAVEETERKTFNSTMDALRKISKNEGTLTLWRGLSPTLMMAVPGNVIYFAGYDWLRTSKQSPMKGRVREEYAPIVAGSLARIIAGVAIGPLEMFRTRMQATQSASPTGIFRETLRGMYDLTQTRGYTSLWRGLTLTLWRDVPFSAIYWWGYERTRNILTDTRDRARGNASLQGSTHRQRSQSRSQQSHASTLIDSFVAGAVSGAVASLVTTPFDVGKTRQQVFIHAEIFSSKDVKIEKHLRPEERSMPKFIWHIFKHEGLPGLFKGWAPRCLKVAPACGIMISSYELGKKMAANINEKKKASMEL